jgi:hypothetical protein
MSTEPTATPNPLSERIGDASAVLVLAPSLDAHDDEACLDLLTVTEPADENVLSVTITQSADKRVQLWDAHVDERPVRVGIISAGEFTRSAATATSSSPQTPPSQHSPESLRIETVSDPGDLTGIGIAISTFLSEWAENETQTVACFHSITPLLQYANLQRIFRFLHVLTGRFESMGVVAHFHLDPGAHDQQAISTLTPLFDAVVDLDDKGEWCVRQR